MTQASALLFADIVDSTVHVERLGDARASALWATHDRLSRELLHALHGREIDRTDGFFLLFPSAADALRYAMAYQRALRELGLAARIGLHFGEVTLRENTVEDGLRGAKRFEVDGIAKPFAARLMTLATGGQTLSSASAREAIGDPLPVGVEGVSHGHYRLKGLAEPVPIFELGVSGGNAFAPPPDTDKCYRVVRIDDGWRPVREIVHTLPVERDSFVGRASELLALARRFDAGARMVTVLGPGGTGKTRLVVRYGWTWLGDWAGGICFCDLSEARSIEGILSAVAVALAVPLDDAQGSVQLGHAIHARRRCLVILDNCEQVADHVASLLGLWLDRCVEAGFLATSRERLRIAGEEVFTVEPLPLEGAAVELFAARAASQRPGFEVDDGNRATVVEIVRLLDGLPLAIELAAARIRLLSPSSLVERMRDRFSLLTGVRGGAARQATLRAAIDWSWDLLAEWEQSALAQCAVFEGPFALSAAEAVLDLSAWSEAPSAIDAMQSLVDKSLLRHWPGEPTERLEIDEPYFGMYVSIHEYANARLDATDHRAVQVRHGHHFARFGSDDAIDAIRRHGGERRWLELATELDDLVVACRRAVLRSDAGVAVATYRAAAEVVEQQGPLSLAASLGAEVLRLTTLDDAQRAAASLRHGTALGQLGATTEARDRLHEATALYRRSGLRRLEGRAMAQLASLDRQLSPGRNQQCRDVLKRSVEIARETGDRLGEGAALAAISKVEDGLGLMDEAAASAVAALAIHRQTGDRGAEAISLGLVAARYLDVGDFDRARDAFEAALRLHREAGSKRSASTELVNLGTLHFRHGRIDDAERCYREALDNDRTVGARAHESMVLTTLVLVHDARGQAAEALACCEQSLSIARETGRPSLIAYALTNLGGLHQQVGRVTEARRAFAEAEPIARGGARLQLGKFLCVRGVSDVAAGDRAAANAAFAEAEAIAEEVGAGPGSGLRVVLTELRTALDR